VKKGDLVFRQSWSDYGDQYGIIISRRSADSFDVMFGDGITKGVWVLELVVISEDR
tara:strand:+ start:214 stop:381 length:168 start_codon:yes stop_codon:yes gene_type:complete